MIRITATDDADKIPGLVKQLLLVSGGRDGFVNRWLEAVEGARAAGEHVETLRHLSFALRLMAVADEQRRTEASHAGHAIEDMSDAEIERRRRAAVLRAAKEDPEAIVEVLRQAGWNITAIHSRDHGS